MIPETSCFPATAKSDDQGDRRQHHLCQGYTAWVSMHDWNLIGGKGDFVGLDNFANVLAQTNFRNVTA